MSSIPVADVMAAIVKVGAELGTDLIELFQKHEPRLKTDPLPDAERAMLDARKRAFERASKTDPPPK